MLHFITGCSIPSKRHHNPEVTIVSNGSGSDFYFLREPTRKMKPDPLQIACGYAKSDVVASIFFDFNRADVGERFAVKINEAAKFFADHCDLSALVVGHCDHFGTNTYNSLLGHRRAENIKAKLIEAGLNENRIVIISAGSERASEKSSNKTTTAADRRVDIVFFKPEVTSP
ncbi:MAG: OmpA family protein [Puniceicoccales bacterium]|nr:OmpA family protein [Puniceicoccales bacterium]